MTQTQVPKVVELMEEVSFFPHGTFYDVQEISSVDVSEDCANSLITRNMSAQRRREYLVGRTIANRLLRVLSSGYCLNEPGAQRQPVWPGGVTGSISHSDGWCVVAVAESRLGLTSLGVDLASTEPLDSELLAYVCTPKERHELNNCDLSVDPFKLVFSLKEAIYKAVFPLIRCYVDFIDVELAYQEGEFRISEFLGIRSLSHQVKLSYLVSGLMLHTCCIIESSEVFSAIVSSRERNP